MLADAHVHMGYYLRAGYEEPFYYSPRRIVGVLTRCGVDEFIVSSTCAQVHEIHIDDILRESKEMKRLAGSRAHLFFWLSGHLYDEDRDMRWLDTGLFEGIKLHDGETPWVGKRRGDLTHILSVANERKLSVMFHSGISNDVRPCTLAQFSEQFSRVHFNFAHCRPMQEMSQIISAHDNVWTDTAYLRKHELRKLDDFSWHGRLMFGTDLPVWQEIGNISLTREYKNNIKSFAATRISSDAFAAFKTYLA